MSTATEQHVSAEQLQTDAINTIRFLAVDAVEKAKSGHPGAPMGDAPIAYTLYTKHMRHNPKNPNWFNRDRFVLSNGHASMLLYSILYLTGYDLPLEQLQQFRQWGSRTAGHPERGLTPGVEVTTGPLGQGFGMGVGMGVAGKYLAATYNKPDHQIIDNFIYVLAGDGCMQEGISNEGASIAGHLNLDNLIYLYDDNDISIEGNTNNTFTEDVGKRFEALNWHVQHVADVNNLAELDAAIDNAKSVKGQPHLIVVKTHIGYGSPNRQDTGKIHGEALGPDEVKATKENLGWPLEPTFYVPDEVLSYYRQAVERGEKLEQEWNEKYAAYKAAYPQEAQALEQALRFELPEGWNKDLPKWGADEKPSATRRASGKILNAIAPYLPNFIGGSGDLAGSTNTTLEKFGSFEPLEQYGGSYTGRTLHYGVREHIMGAIINGATAYGGVRIYGATFLSFLDYMREPVRLAALMELPSIFIFTHDSIGQGEDGPTHQPIEHLAILRATPRLSTIRPADPNETAVAWKVALETTHQPTVLVFCRQDVPVLDQSKYTPASEGLPKGAYILSEAEGGQPQVILIATGSEVSLALEGQKALQDKGIAARVVSMPSWNLFEEQGEDYKQSVLPDSIPARLAIEAASSFGWQEYVGDKGAVLGLNRFGASAPGKVALEKFGFTVENVVRLSELLINDPKQARAEAKKIQDARFEWEGHNPNQSAAGNEGHS